MLRACRGGDARAWDNLIDKYERLVFSIPLSYGLSREDAADICQVTFTIFMQSMDSLRDDSRLGAWLATVARRHTWRLMKKNRREGTRGGEDLTGSDIAESVASIFGDGKADAPERWETMEWLDQGLSEIGGPCRELLTVLYFDDDEPSYTEVSERLGMPMGSIGPTRARCLKRLKEALEGLE
ncbi:MAG: sigma-70 family RNA polymerase sigma factor [Rubrobacter sp.]|nr:sigma-70 family RNA polymerase sigma factor [Rubrobacter sp.]